MQTPANPNPRNGGPENSLTLWSDQGDGEILCDYGAAYSFMLYLYDRFGQDFMSALHRQDLNGLAGLQATLDQFVTGETALGVVHKWAAMVAVDQALETTSLRGQPNAKHLYSTPDLHASINWDAADAYSTPGAPPNGSDYVRLRDAQGRYLTAAQLTSLSFQGAKSFPAKPIEWTVDSGALYSGTGDLLDRAIVRQVSVPTAGANLSFDTRWNLEETWDFGFVQVSTDGGATYQSVQCADTRSDFNPDAFPTVKANVPGLTGVQDWKTETCDLSAYAGKTVYLSFRDVTDWSTEGNDGASFAPGWWVKNVAIAGTTIADGTSLAGWKSVTEVHPVPVTGGFTVQLVGISSTGTYATIVSQVPVDSNFSANLTGGSLKSLIGDEVDVVAAIVTYDEPTESITDYAPYTLKVNGVTRPGGGA